MPPDSLRFIRRSRLEPGEWLCIALVVVAMAAAMLAPPLAQDGSYHVFADQRAILGVPRGADVLSSLAFLAVALAAVARLADRSRKRFNASTEGSLWMLAVGLAATSFGSVYYHLDPRNATLFYDRLPMTLAFAGIVGVAVSQRISARAGAWLMPIVALVGMASVLYWRTSGNLMPYAAVHLGTALALVACAALTRPRGDPFPWWWVVGWYAVAKIAEMFDAPVYELTGELIAGHTIKHLAAAAAGAAAMWPVIARERSVSRRS